jgi:hypothetical protein
MVAAMAATVPAGIHIWRRLFRNNRNVEAGVALHASLFCGGAFSFIAVSYDWSYYALHRIACWWMAQY